MPIKNMTAHGIALILGITFRCCLCSLDAHAQWAPAKTASSYQQQQSLKALNSEYLPSVAAHNSQQTLVASTTDTNSKQQAGLGQLTIDLASHSSSKPHAQRLRSQSGSHQHENIFTTTRRQLSQQLLQAPSRSSIGSSDPIQPGPAPTPPSDPIFPLPPPTDYQPPPQPPSTPSNPPPSQPPPPPPSNPSRPPASDPPSTPSVPAPSSPSTPGPIPESPSSPSTPAVPEPAPSSPSSEEKSPSQSPKAPESPIVVFESPSTTSSPSPVASPKASPSTRPRRNIPAKPIDPQPEEELPDAVLEEAENSDETTAADTPIIPAETVTVSMLLRGVTPQVFNTTYSAKLLEVVARVSGTPADQWTAKGVTARLEDDQQQSGSSTPSSDSNSSSGGSSSGGGGGSGVGGSGSNSGGTGGGRSNSSGNGGGSSSGGSGGGSSSSGGSGSSSSSGGSGGGSSSGGGNGGSSSNSGGNGASSSGGGGGNSGGSNSGGSGGGSSSSSSGGNGGSSGGGGGSSSSGGGSSGTSSSGSSSSAAGGDSGGSGSGGSSSSDSGGSSSSSNGGGGGSSGRKLLQQPQSDQWLYVTASILTANPMLVVYRLSQAPTAGSSNAQAAAGCTTELCNSLMSSGIPIDSSSIEVRPNFDSSFGSSSGSSPESAQSNNSDAQMAYTRQLAVIIVCSIAGFVILLILAINSRRIIDRCAACCCGPEKAAAWQERRQQQRLDSLYDRKGPIVSQDRDHHSEDGNLDSPRISFDWVPTPMGQTTEVSKFMKKGDASDLEYVANSGTGDVPPAAAGVTGSSTGGSFSNWMPSMPGFGHMAYQPFEAYQYNPRSPLHYPPQQQEFTLYGETGGHGFNPQQPQLREIIEHNMLYMEEDLAALQQQMQKFLASKHQAAAEAARLELIPEAQSKKSDAAAPPAASGSNSD